MSGDLSSKELADELDEFREKLFADMKPGVELLDRAVAFLRTAVEPDSRCISTPDGGCVSNDCMHTDTPTNRAQARLDAARIVDAMTAAQVRSALIDAISRGAVTKSAATGDSDA